MNKYKYRIKQYGSVSTTLACYSNEQLMQILANAKSIHEGIGGKSSLIHIDEIPVFVKKIPLTDVELLPHNFRNTTNIFELPLYYQYGIGSAGFSAWRELVAQIMTTNWVIIEDCINFPIMYHWRILPNVSSDLNCEYWQNIEKYSHYWENSSAIRKRAEDLKKASHYIILFLEYIPQNLQQWLNNQITKGGKTAESAIICVDQNLKNIISFMNTHNLMHFDVHFENILTDGELLYFSDFGLALTSKFELTEAEIKFLKHHHNYDQCCSILNLLHCIISTLFGKDQWEFRLREYISGEYGPIPQAIRPIIKNYAPIALTMDTFFQKLQKENKSTPYPEMHLDKLLKASLLENLKKSPIF